MTRKENVLRTLPYKMSTCQGNRSVSVPDEGRERLRRGGRHAQRTRFRAQSRTGEGLRGPRVSTSYDGSTERPQNLSR